ncbi:hypothetical protein PUMCH_002915 [Australozyma saopauloensis]|uniref:Transcription initiation factor TFIID subunit 4 n=1 Tax=Australozyma saopauloensis TaxID=291208 RepID=A0AAX4HB06_9ASCO|nr:hypothetical protein PUMCH_002915 [[Candida] saopauloensis]
MSQNNSKDLPGGQKRPLEDSSVGGDNKRVATDSTLAFPENDGALGDIFDLLLFETRTGIADVGYGLQSGTGLELPDFLNDSSDISRNASGQTKQGAQGSQSTNNIHSSLQSSHSLSIPMAGSLLQLSDASRVPNPQQYRAQPSVPRTNSTPRLNDSNATSTGGVSTTSVPPGGLYHSQSTLSLNSASYPRQGAPINNASSNRPGAGLTSPYRATMRFDPKRTYPGARPPAPAQGSGSYGFPSLGAPSNNAAGDKDKAEDPTKLNDALAAAGVDLQREEELLSTNYTRMPMNSIQQQIAQRQRLGYVPTTQFLQPYHLAVFMNRVGRENGMGQNFMLDTEMLEFMSSACKEWISNLVAKTVTMARHRRRGIPALSSTPGNGSGGLSSRQKFVPQSQRSEVSKDLRELALRQKTLEERRVEKRTVLGLERTGEVAPETSSKDGNDETLHRAANATAAMMTMNPARKKYSWMTSGASGSGVDDSKVSAGKDSGSKQSALILARGDNGLRFREIRTGNMITTRDLLSVIEDERMGTSKAVVKGYARLKD